MVTKKRFIVAVISVMFSSSVANCQWITQDSGVSTKLRDVCFVDTLHGWAVGDNATIITTIDGGKTWQRQESPVKTIALKKVQFVNRNVGYIVGPFATILATKDGGITWLKSESGIESTFSCDDLSFVNEDRGWVACGDPQPRRRGVILHTGNGGQTWERQLDTYYLGKLRVFSAIAFLDEEHGWAIGGYYMDNLEHPEVYRTVDGGKHWYIIGNALIPIYHMSIVSTDTIWAGGGDSMGTGFVMSFDGGLNWVGKPSFKSSIVLDLVQIDGHTGWVVNASRKEGRKEGKIRFTDDAGTTWREILVNEGPTLVAIANAGINYLWAVGESGVVLRYKDSTVSVNHPVKSSLPKKYELKQNYPNPFNSSTTITYSITKPSHITLAIFAINGQKVANLVDGRIESGTHSVRFDATNLGSGVYFYRFTSPEFKKTGKMLLVR